MCTFVINMMKELVIFFIVLLPGSDECTVHMKSMTLAELQIIHVMRYLLHFKLFYKLPVSPIASF